MSMIRSTIALGSIITRGEVHQNRSEALWSLWRPFIAISRGVAQRNLPAFAHSFQFRRTHRRRNAYGCMEMILYQMVSDVSSLLCSYLQTWLALFVRQTKPVCYSNMSNGLLQTIYTILI